MPFTFKLSKRLALMRASTLALTAAAVFACEPGDQLPSAPLTAVLTATSPGTVSDLRVTAANDTSVTLAFTEVDDGTGLPASYDIRLLVGAISWGSAADVVRGSCATPVVGASIGSTHSCVVLGLAASTTYNFQLVAFRGTLNVTPVFGGLSNIASGTTGVTATAAPGGGTLLFQEAFEDNAFAARGWYDNTGMAITDTEHVTGSTHALEAHFLVGARAPTWGGSARHLFPATPT